MCFNTDTCEYNALGQLARPCDNGAPYLAMDGDNAYQTVFAAGMSGWTWVHGPGLDDPLLGRYRMPGDTLRDLYYLTDGNGRQLAVADSAGSLQHDDVNTIGKSDHRFAGGTRNSATFYADRFAVGDIPGVSFFRNRMYDTRTGRWTQEDPIGVAGGVNLYQFNGNNPVAFADPFGLTPDCPPDCDASDAADLAAGMTPGLSSFVDGATVLTGRNPITGESVGLGGRLIALAGLATPASGGELRGAGKLVTAAAKALSERIGKNSVSVAIEGGFKRVDLVGKAHKGVPTPHIHEYILHQNPTTGRARYKKEFKGPATRQDVVDAARAAGQ